MTDPIKTLLLLALPASGKSEIRRYLHHVDRDTCRRDFGLAPTTQLDDFPYVHVMRRIDEELIRTGGNGVFFSAPDRSFRDPRDWGTLIALLNEDYADLTRQPSTPRTTHADALMMRMEAASLEVGVKPRLQQLEPKVWQQVASQLEDEARQIHDAKAENNRKRDGHTVVIEFARGGSEGATLPLVAPWGYGYSLSLLSAEILQSASILYVWVTPQESRRKNAARANPDDPGSILHHGVPEFVMRNDYGQDDIAWLMDHASKPGTVEVRRNDGVFHVPIARFDNRIDKTSFVRDDRKAWQSADVNALHEGLKAALTSVVSRND